MESLNLKKIFLYLLMISVGLSVAIGILVVLIGTQEQSTKILLTSLTITGASFSMFLNGVFFEKLRTKILPVLGFLITPVCAALSITAIWGETAYKPLATAFTLLDANFFLIPMAFYFERKRARIIPLVGLLATLVLTGLIISLIWELTPESEFGRKLFYVSNTVALACFYLSLISLFNLIKKFQWSLIAVQAVTWVLVAVLSVRIITTSIGDPPSELFNRSVTILTILITALTVLIPVFSFLSRSAFGKDAPDIADIDREIVKLKEKLAELEERKRKLESETPTTS
jgi:hypothetical protein